MIIPAHTCRANHDLSSKAMKPETCVDLVIDLFDKGIAVRRIVADDDSSLRANTKHSYKGE